MTHKHATPADQVLVLTLPLCNVLLQQAHQSLMALAQQRPALVGGILYGSAHLLLLRGQSEQRHLLLRNGLRGSGLGLRPRSPPTLAM